MTTHKMNLQQKYFDFIKNGTKRIELRLFDEKRQKIQLDDTIEFNNDNDETIVAKVVGLLHYESFQELFNDFDISILADTSMTKAELQNALEEFYTPERQKKYGVLGIRLKIL